MTQSTDVTALDLGIPARDALPDETQRYFAKCDEKLGMVPNVLQAYSHRPAQLDAFSRYYNELMFGESGLSSLEREMIAVVVSSINHCFYCLTAHGAAVRQYSENPQLGEMLVMNFRAAPLDQRQRAMLDFAALLTEAPDRIDEADRQALRDAGFSDRDIWDIANVTGFYNMTNRVAAATEMQPNPEYHSQCR
ncbi:peroxidase-related enzyme [Motiliproteus sediminis]|uniref:peroxidase-related enzyme n=1 Tax=Motiliproteus sediminis TaxID=1468178 RepID=UPI001AF01AB8|nr:peroxidase-related enzyme [Motiliproteus sediminis]